MLKRFFGKTKQAAPAQPADLVRRLFIKGADADGMRRAVAGYAEVMGKTEEMVALVLGVEAGWLVVDIPASVSAYYFHNLGSWFEAGHEVVTSSWSRDDHWHYVLLEEAEPSDYLIGVHESGARLTVGRPMHVVIRDDDDTVPWASASDILAGKNIPVDLAQRAASTFPASQPVSLLVEVGDDGLNPGLQTTHKRRPDPRYYTL